MYIYVGDKKWKLTSCLYSLSSPKNECHTSFQNWHLSYIFITLDCSQPADDAHLPKSTSDCIQSYHNPRGGGNDDHPSTSPAHPNEKPTSVDRAEIQALIVSEGDTPPCTSKENGIQNGDVVLEMKPRTTVAMVKDDGKVEVGRCVIAVTGMTCASCVNTIEKSLIKQRGKLCKIPCKTSIFRTNAGCEWL